MSNDETTNTITGLEIAIIGMAGRFPGAPALDTFWQNLHDGVESITFFSDDELAAAGIDRALLRDSNYVKAGAVLDDIDLFDAAFFGFSPREAELTDPQQRLFLECAWEALEHAGYDPHRYQGAIGVYAGAGLSTYASGHPELSRAFLGTAEDYQVMIGNQKDFLTTRVSYKLNLKGPSLSIQTACSTALVAVHLACQSLISGESDIALAGGVSVRVPHRAGYLYQPGGITAPDGHCRAFDAGAQGTVIGSGLGIVVLKRLEDALADGDTIHAVIKGSAINNDGILKAGYMAPSIDGQARVIRVAQRLAGVEPETIGYIETHGTGTALGDPIEIAALTEAFRTRTERTGFCAIGSLKTNIGHLDAAAGVAGLIKTVLALQHRQIPPSLHFERPNPQIDFANSPFYVNTALREWPAYGAPRRAGVSAFGIGGTNAHVILEEAPPAEPSATARPWQLLTLSARTAAALEQQTHNLAEKLRLHPDLNLADVAYTLQVGRHAFNHRRVVVCRDAADALATLESHDTQRMVTAVHTGGERPVVFMFPGGGAQHVDMGRALYQSEPVFREWIDRCAELLRRHLRLDLRDILYPQEPTTDDRRPTTDGAEDGGWKIEDGSLDTSEKRSSILYPPSSSRVGGQWSVVGGRELTRPSLALPALFAIDYALAQVWMAWGIRPDAMIGHSLGEYVAACLAGVLTLEDALALVALRGRLFEQLPRGAMLSVHLSERDILPLLNPQLSLAALNGAAQCVVAGPLGSIEHLAGELARRGVSYRPIPIDVAAHSAMLEPILEPFTRFVASLDLRAPTIPYVSNVTGGWITAEQATDPHYWTRHLRETVRFSAGITMLARDPGCLFIEVGPGRALSTFVKQTLGPSAGQSVLTSLPHPTDSRPDDAFLMLALGQLWMAGVPIDWPRLYPHERRRRVPLPAYPFERRRHWLAASPAHRYVGPAPRSVEQTDSTAAQNGTPPAGIDNAPRHDTERILAGIWQDVLGIKPVGIHDNFFALGGDSLLAVHLLARIRNELRVDLPPHSLLQSPTIADLAVQCGRAQESAIVETPPHPALVVLQASGTRRPLFLVHPAGGGVYIYRELAGLLGPDQPIYGLHAHAFAELPMPRVEAMAAEYLAAITTVQPSGPYLLGGSSFGGVVAFEIAQQLQARGEEVELLALIDTAHPYQLQPRMEDEDAILMQVLGIDSAELPRRPAGPEPDAYLRTCLELAQAGGRIPPDFGLDEFRHYLGRLAGHLQAMRAYRPRIYSGSIVFFRASERDPLNPPAPERGWKAITAGGVELYDIPGNHTTMNYTPNVQVLAAYLSQHLAAVLTTDY